MVITTFVHGLQIQRLSLYKQIELFQGTQVLIRNTLGTQAADKFFQEARYVVALGSNDFINNYLTGVYNDSWKYNDQSFLDYLMETLEDQLTVRTYYYTYLFELLSVHGY